MNTRRDGTAGGATKEGQWPYCAMIEGTCLPYEMGQFLGGNIQSALLTFIFGAEQGARLILQKNHDGFTIQVTEAVQKATAEGFGLPEVRALRRRLELLTSRGPT